MSHTRQRIVITGFMGAGKSTAAAALARILGRASLDLDDAITAREGRTPQQLIDEDGEAAFRECETRALREALESGGAQVIATGGGTWTLKRNRALAAEHGCLSVWLDAPFNLCWERVTRNAEVDRPFARDRAAARRLYERRLADYALADLRVSVTPRHTAAEVAVEIAFTVRRLERESRRDSFA
jgi:shikimate kinase